APPCINGKITAKNKCECDPGFTGYNCSSCDFTLVRVPISSRVKPSRHLKKNQEIIDCCENFDNKLDSWGKDLNELNLNWRNFYLSLNNVLSAGKRLDTEWMETIVKPYNITYIKINGTLLIWG
ncbi:unnamed protein product, partial [Meganyctiphanes norvegica]